MYRHEHLLLVMQEEAIEVGKVSLELAHRISKAIRFSVTHDIPGTDKNNRMDIGTQYAELRVMMEELNKEFSQVTAMLEMNHAEGVHFTGFDDPAIKAKKKIVFEEFLLFSKARGTLQDEPEVEAITEEVPKGTYLYAFVLAKDILAAYSPLDENINEVRALVVQAMFEAYDAKVTFQNTPGMAAPAEKTYHDGLLEMQALFSKCSLQANPNSNIVHALGFISGVVTNNHRAMNPQTYLSGLQAGMKLCRDQLNDPLAATAYIEIKVLVVKEEKLNEADPPEASAKTYLDGLREAKDVMWGVKKASPKVSSVIILELHEKMLDHLRDLEKSMRASEPNYNVSVATRC